MKIKLICISAFLISLSCASLWADKGTTSGGTLSHMESFSSRILIPSISLIQSQSTITTKFLSNIGLIDIVIKDSKGNIIYFESVDTSYNDQLFINTLGFTSDIYSIFAIQNNRHIFSQNIRIN